MIEEIIDISKKTSVRIIILITFFLFLLYLFRYSGIRLQDITPLNLKEYLLNFGFLKGAIIFLVAYIVSIRPFIPVPPTVFTIAGGFTFGPIWGAVLSVTGATLNASLTFLLARAFGEGFVEKLTSGRFESICNKLSNCGFKELLLLRSFPFGLPFDLISYGSGILRVPFWKHFFATLIGIIPVVCVLSYFGSAMTTGGITILIVFFLIVLAVVIVPRLMRGNQDSEDSDLT